MVLDSALSIAGRFIENPRIAPNAVISFEVNTETGGTDPPIEFDEVGNPIIGTPATETVTLQAYLRQKKAPFADVQAGANLDAEYFEGRLVEPKEYPFPIRSTGDIEITINGRSGILKQLNWLESPASEQYRIASEFGARIKCYVRFEQGN